jgi:hypothetical protein
MTKPKPLQLKKTEACLRGSGSGKGAVNQSRVWTWRHPNQMDHIESAIAPS